MKTRKLLYLVFGVRLPQISPSVIPFSDPLRAEYSASMIKSLLCLFSISLSSPFHHSYLTFEPL